MHEFSIQSDLAVAPAAFWAATSMSSVNWELAPIVRMSAPREWQDCAIERWETGSKLFDSWILLFGFVPVDLHSFRLQEIFADSGFQECSSSWMNKEWRHRRIALAGGQGCIVTDHVVVVGRIPLLSALLMPVYRFVFRHRHRRLRKQYKKAG